MFNNNNNKRKEKSERSEKKKANMMLDCFLINAVGMCTSKIRIKDRQSIILYFNF